MEPSTANPDPQFHTARIRKELDELVAHLRDDTAYISEPKAQAMFETAAEVLRGLQTAFAHYDEGREKALRPGA
jgi:hypothetical protein